MKNMLTPEEQIEFLAAIEKVKTVATRQLLERTYPDNVMRIIPQLHHNVDALFVQETTTGKEIACRAGCSYCCHVRVEAKPPEIDYIARQLKLLPDAELTHILAHMYEGFIEKGRLAVAEPQKRAACVLLENQQCMIYANRPAVCRKGHSTDAQRCAEGAQTIPQHLDIILKAEALIQGVGAAYADVQLSGESQEFTTALWDALNI